MTVDVPGVRAFLAVAEEMHFGRAAQRLFLTQQALSRRVRRLEEALATPLFDRTTRRVELTAAGRRFLPLAREALAAFDSAVEAVRDDPGRLRVDVFDERFSPRRILRDLIDADPDLRIEPGMRQGLALALPAVRSREIDAAFGQVHDLPGPWPSELAHRLVHLEPMAAFVGRDHPLAGVTRMRPADLPGISMPDPGGATEARAFLTRIARHFEVPIRFIEPAMGLSHYAELINRDQENVALGEASVELTPEAAVHRIRLTDPTPLAPWSVVWHRHNTKPQLQRLLRALPTARIPSLGHWLPPEYR
ncbi:LysR family transcriptional regulator [Spirillospora sp. CA-294931]|uniref:LysR family transcriptional regulator n=1 Tax=Spirillospora sp. CA-294931 TaxID=3240042 RepID=UPI003D92001E